MVSNNSQKKFYINGWVNDRVMKNMQSKIGSHTFELKSCEKQRLYIINQEIIILIQPYDIIAVVIRYN